MGQPPASRRLKIWRVPPTDRHTRRSPKLCSVPNYAYTCQRRRALLSVDSRFRLACHSASLYITENALLGRIAPKESIHVDSLKS